LNLLLADTGHDDAALGLLVARLGSDQPSSREPEVSVRL
jgi:hypothetical protein